MSRVAVSDPLYGDVVELGEVELGVLYFSFREESCFFLSVPDVRQPELGIKGTYPAEVGEGFLSLASQKDVFLRVRRS